MDWIVDAENLTFKYPRSEKPVFQNLNLKIGYGEFLLLVGPSGCGKTTLVNCINGIIPHVIEEELEGNVIVDGLNTKETSLPILSQIVGTVFQNPDDQIFSLTVEEEVAFGPENLGLPVSEIRERVDEALKNVGITHLREREISTLSGGQKQRVAIASILAMRPKLLILDEPTSDLDPVGTVAVLETVKRLNRIYNSAILLVEHKLEEVARFVDRVVLMDKGRIIADSPPREIFSNLKLLRSLGVRGPEPTEIAVMLKDKGLPIRDIPLSVEEAYKNLISLRGRWSVGKCKFEGEYGSSNEPIIKIEDLWHVYPNNVVALKGINLEVKKGEYVGIVGENGAGKSTLMAHLIGILKPTKGRVLISGIDTRDARIGYLAKKVGYIFQNPDFMLFNDTVEKEIAFVYLRWILG